MKNFIKILAVCFFSYFFVAIAHGSSELMINVGEAKFKKSLLALPKTQYVGNKAQFKDHAAVTSEVFAVIQNNLKVASYFQFIDEGAFLEDPTKTEPLPAPGNPRGFNFEKWKAIGSDFLIRTSLNYVDNKIVLDTYSYHVPQAKLILGKKYSASIKSARKIAHTFCNDLIKALTGQESMFLSQIVVSSDRAGEKTKEIFIMDWDGNAPFQVTKHRSISISPNWSPDGNKIIYTSFVKRGPKKIRNPDMLLLDLTNGNRWLLSYQTGINSGGTFSPDGKSVYLTISKNGTSDLYKIDLQGKVQKALTKGPNGALNVEPSVSADGERIAFSSDRSGQPMVWVMGSDGDSPKRLTFAGQYNSSPDWSPDGKSLVFASYQQGHYDLYLMGLNGTTGVSLQKLTDAVKPNGKPADNEDPVFSPDGRHIMFTSNRTGYNQIYIINTDGTNERRITQDTHNYFKPRWSKNKQ